MVSELISYGIVTPSMLLIVPLIIHSNPFFFFTPGGTSSDSFCFGLQSFFTVEAAEEQPTAAQKSPALSSWEEPSPTQRNSWITAWCRPIAAQAEHPPSPPGPRTSNLLSPRNSSSSPSWKGNRRSWSVNWLHVLHQLSSGFIIINLFLKSVDVGFVLTARCTCTPPVWSLTVSKRRTRAVIR